MKIGNYAKITKTPFPFSKELIFLQLGILPDAEDNYILFKSVKPDMTSFFSDRFKYVEGINWEDQSLQRDQSIECGLGCHFTTYDRAVAFAEHRPHLILAAKININDILSVYQKVRTKKYTDLRIIKLDF